MESFLRRQETSPVDRNPLLRAVRNPFLTESWAADVLICPNSPSRTSKSPCGFRQPCHSCVGRKPQVLVPHHLWWVLRAVRNPFLTESWAADVLICPNLPSCRSKFPLRVSTIGLPPPRVAAGLAPADLQFYAPLGIQQLVGRVPL
jgi:hypothetical protein